MEENIARIDDLEEIETVEETEEDSENSGAGAFVAGIVGGVLGYAMISGGKKLVTFVGSKWKARKARKSNHDVIEGEIIEETSEQEASDENLEK